MKIVVKLNSFGVLQATARGIAMSTYNKNFICLFHEALLMPVKPNDPTCDYGCTARRAQGSAVPAYESRATDTCVGFVSREAIYKMMSKKYELFPTGRPAPAVAKPSVKAPSVKPTDADLQMYAAAVSGTVRTRSSARAAPAHPPRPPLSPRSPPPSVNADGREAQVGSAVGFDCACVK